MPYLVATLKVAVAFIRTLMGTVPSLQQLLASGTVTDINEAVNLITALYNFKAGPAHVLPGFDFLYLPLLLLLPCHCCPQPPKRLTICGCLL